MKRPGIKLNTIKEEMFYVVYSNDDTAMVNSSSYELMLLLNKGIIKSYTKDFVKRPGIELNKVKEEVFYVEYSNGNIDMVNSSSYELMELLSKGVIKSYC